MKKYLLALAAAALCLGVVASCDKDDEKGTANVVTVVEQDTLLTEAGTPKFLVGGWISEGKVSVPFYDSIYTYYFLYVDERGEGSMGEEYYAKKDNWDGERPGGKYSSFDWIKETKDGRMASNLHTHGVLYATITSRTDTTITFEPFFAWSSKTLKKTAVQPQWKNN